MSFSYLFRLETSESQLEMLQVPLGMFKNQDLDKKQRLGAVELFLIPMLNLVSEAVAEKFYSQEINFILNTAEEKIEANRTQVIYLIFFFILYRTV